MTEILGRLCSLVFNPSSSRQVALIDRIDVPTVHQHHHVELPVAPAAVDQLLDFKGTLDPLCFTIKDGEVIKVGRVMKR
jgi:hypothetical protein